MLGTLFLIPTSLGALAPLDLLPTASVTLLARLDHLIVETPKQARRFLASIGIKPSVHSASLKTLDEHTPPSALADLLLPIRRGQDIGLLSDAGCPGIADPGARLVALAHDMDVCVVPMVGPSAIMLALMGSGLNGQRFSFNGYLPVDAALCRRAIQELERESRVRDLTQVVIETPYRNNRLLAALLRECSPSTRLCVATDLTLPEQFLKTRSIQTWRSARPDLDRRPSVFLLQAAEAQ
jgi:16S rRNA (cytidine1402-2'-O)-methyltransferase